MAARYYTRFLLGSGEPGYTDEYSGVVEVSHGIEQVLEPAEIEAMLARNFHCESDEVRVLNWSRVH